MVAVTCVSCCATVTGFPAGQGVFDSTGRVLGIVMRDVWQRQAYAVVRSLRRQVVAFIALAIMLNIWMPIRQQYPLAGSIPLSVRAVRWTPESCRIS